MIADVNLIENKSCINRNILECKYRTQLNDNEVYECINRNILECKYA